MALDSYSYCPGGTGKKIKFCCTSEVTGELEKCIRQIDGEQRMAALDQINRSLQLFPDRACLLALKVNVLIGLQELDKAKETITHFLQKNPGNPVALAQAAILAVIEGNDIDSASVFLQSALSQMGNVMMPEIFQAIGILAQAQLEAGRVEAAQPLFIMQAAVTKGEDRMALSALAEIAGARQIPLLLRMEWRQHPAPAGQPWTQQYQEIDVLANQGCWSLAQSQLVELNQKYPNQAEILRFLAVLSLWQGQRGDAASYLHQYAAAEGVARDDAIEAEALAQLLDAFEPKSQIEVVTWIQEVTDAQAVMEKLLSDKRALTMPIDVSQLGSDNEPPPKGVFWILDRPSPETGVGLTADTVPLVEGDIFVFGRQTDRAPRIEFSVAKSANFERRIATVRDILGDALVGEPKEQSAGHTSAEAEMLSANFRFPNDTPAETRTTIMDEWRSRVITEKWPEFPRDALGGKSPLQVKDDPSLAVRLAAAVLLFELQLGESPTSEPIKALRAKLGLPEPELLSSTGLNVERLPPTRLHRLDPKRLTDADLVHAYQRARAYKINETLLSLGEELLERGGTSPNDKITILSDMASSASTTDRALEYVERGRKISVSLNQSVVTWLLLELSIRLARREAQEAERLLQTIMTRHAEEPGVRHAVGQILSSYGVLPQGARMPRRPGPGEGAPAMAAAPTPPSEGVWTPESAPASPPAEKSKLWLPGMD